MTIDQPALQGLAPRRRRERSPEPLAGHLPVAQVVVDRPQPHLDRVFDYAVPERLAHAAQPGVRVRVRFAGQDVDGYVVGRSAGSDRELVPLRRVVSPEQVLTPEVLALARRVAERYAGTLPDVLRLAVPPRHARVEAEVPPGLGPVPGKEPAAPGTEPASAVAWADYAGGAAFLDRIAAGQAPRAVWQVLPGGPATWADAVATAALVALRAGRGVLVVAPSATEVAVLEAALDRAGVPAWRPGVAGGRVRLLADDGPAERYRAFLAALRGHARVVVGTRAAAFAPVAGLGLLVCWDDGDDLLAEPRAPYPHARDVLAMRSEVAAAALLIGGHSRTTAAQRLIAVGWARPLDPPRRTIRQRAPRVVALTSAELAREGPAAAARLPGPAWRAARTALERGPVLVQVPRAGYVPVLACGGCRRPASCRACAGALAVPAPGIPPECRVCGAPAGAWRCPECGSSAVRAVRVGSERTAEELGRAFPGVPVRVSGGGARIDAVPARPVVVVATPGAEPVAEGGYAAALLLDAAVATGRPALDAAEQALRSWLRAAALVQPASAGGVVMLVGDAAPAPTQALVRWDPAGHAERELAERAEVRLPPAVHVVAVDGPRDAVRRVLDRFDPPPGTDVVGPAPLRGEPLGDPTPATLLDVEAAQRVRALVRSPWGAAGEVTRRLGGVVAARAAQREAPVRLQAEPLDVW